MQKYHGFTDTVYVFYDEEGIENRGGEKCCYFLFGSKGQSIIALETPKWCIEHNWQVISI